MRISDWSSDVCSSDLLTSVDVGNATTNVIPAKATALFNVRFNDIHSSGTVESWIRERLHRAIDDSRGARSDLTLRVSGESLLCPPAPRSALLSDAVAPVTGRAPQPAPTVGPSDARYIKDHCPVSPPRLRN